MPLFPAIVFLILSSYHANPYITATGLSGILVVYEAYAIVIWFIVYLISKNPKETALATIGFALAALFIKSNDLQSDFMLLAAVEGIFIPLIPTFFSSLSKILVEQFEKPLTEYMLQIEAFFIISLISLLLAVLVSNALGPNTNFSLNNLTPVEAIYLLLMSVALVLLFLALYTFLRVIRRLLRYVRSDSLSMVEDNMSDRLSYLPIYATENPIDADLLKNILSEGIQWWNKDTLKDNVKAGLNNQLYKNLPEDSKIIAEDAIEKFVDETSKLAPKIIKEYVSVYDTLKKETQNDKRLIAALFNSIIGADKHSWPNIYNTITNDKDLNTRFKSILTGFLQIRYYDVECLVHHLSLQRQPKLPL